MSTSLYLHVPFCRRVCPYCDFYVVPAARRDAGSAPFGDFVDALRRELQLVAAPGGAGELLSTVHFGGGTPSALTLDELERILGAIREVAVIETGAEVALEANPEDLTEEYVAGLAGVGINRLTIGIQSLDDTALKLLGRKHRRDAALAAIGAARRGGVSNLGVDLIFGVPGQSEASWSETLASVLDQRPEHLSCYELTIEPATELARARERGELAEVDADRIAGLFVATHERLASAGYEHYEASNYARGSRFRSRHNLNYWRHGRYLGVGPSAHSFDGTTRWWNHRSLGQWQSDLASGRVPIAEREVLTPNQLRSEEILLGLRCVDGFPLEVEVGGEGSGRGQAPPLRQHVLGEAVSSGYLVLDGDRVRPTIAGMAIADELARRLCP